MDPILIANIIGAVGPLAAQIIGDLIAAGDKQKAMKVYEDAYEKAQGMKPPPQQTMTAIEQAASSLTGYQEDPALKAAQMKALEGLSAEVSARGLTPEAQAEYNRARLEAGQMEAGARGAAEARMAARGMQTGTGALAAELGAGQAATNRLAMQGVEIAGDARRRYLQALEALGGMGSKMRGQEFDIAAQRAAAQDAINRFNVGQRSEAQKYNLGAGQREFENQMDLARMRQGAGGRYAGALYGRAADTQETAGRYGGAIQSGAEAVGRGMSWSDKIDKWRKANPGQKLPWED